MRLKRTVALKVIAPEYAKDADFRQRFERESELAASLDHPNVIPIFDAGEETGELFITMRFVDGTDLKALIDRRTRLEPGMAAEIVSQAADALDQAHSHGLIHRDVKPANLLIRSDDRGPHVYLTDFGLTKRASSETAMTGTGMFVGTVDYISPEQLNGAPLDARADVYSLGGVLFHALTGQVPYPRPSDPAEILAHVSDPPPSPQAFVPDLPEEFEAVIRRAMEKDIDARFLSAGDLGRAAVAAAQGSAVTRAEKSVATGAAAQFVSSPTVTADVGQALDESPPRRRRRSLPKLGCPKKSGRRFPITLTSRMEDL